MGHGGGEGRITERKEECMRREMDVFDVMHDVLCRRKDDGSPGEIY